MSLRHVRKHWKKYTAGAVTSLLLSSFFVKRFREKNVTKEVCRQVKQLADQPLTETEKLKKVLVFYNPTANGQKCSKYFRKYAEPILHASDIEVTVVTSLRAGYIKMIMEYVDSKTDAFVVAGGDGTLFEVINGIMRRKDAEVVSKIPIAVVPLGKENKVFKMLFPSHHYKRISRQISEAVKATFNGHVKPVSLIEIEPEEGEKVYGVSGISWGAFKDAEENRDGFKLFGPFRLLFSYINVALRRWPEDCILHIWSPYLSENSSSPTVSPPLHSDQLNTAPPLTTSASSSTEEGEAVSLSDPLKTGTDGWTHLSRPAIGMNIRVVGNSLLLLYWSGGINKQDFIKQGWLLKGTNLVSTSNGGDEISLKPNCLKLRECVLYPQSHKESWLSIDGEGFEAVQMKLKILPQTISIMYVPSLKISK